MNQADAAFSNLVGKLDKILEKPCYMHSPFPNEFDRHSILFPNVNLERLIHFLTSE